VNRLSRFWGQKVKVQCHSKTRYGHRRQLWEFWSRGFKGQGHRQLFWQRHTSPRLAIEDHLALFFILFDGLDLGGDIEYIVIFHLQCRCIIEKRDFRFQTYYCSGMFYCTLQCHRLVNLALHHSAFHQKLPADFLSCLRETVYLVAIGGLQDRSWCPVVRACQFHDTVHTWCLQTVEEHLTYRHLLIEFILRHILLPLMAVDQLHLVKCMVSVFQLVRNGRLMGQLNHSTQHLTQCLVNNQ